MIPLPWRIDYCALSIQVYKDWVQSGSLAESTELLELLTWLRGKNYDCIILRSSGVSETLNDRGKYKSKVLSGAFGQDEILQAIEKIFEHARKTDENEKLSIVVQEYKKPVFSGHLSNEHRVSPTINQWAYELEKPNWAPRKGINSKQTTSPDPGRPLKCGNQLPHQPLRSVAHFLAEEFKERCHIEWFVHHSTLYIAQIDFEWPQQDCGINPRKDFLSSTPPSLNLEKAKIFKPYSIGQPTKWPKLKNLAEFDFDNNNPAPKIYSFSPKLLKSGINERDKRENIITEMVALTGDRLVVRTDCTQKGKGHFNLPRTDTVNAKSAFKWCKSVAKKLESQGIKESNYVFLFHAFLPAQASAWAYASPQNPTVIIDALWGLPDGLQVLPVDTYEVNVKQNKVVQTKSTFKPKFLTELEDGSWDYQKIRSLSGRSQVLSDSDKKEIALRTRAIADSLQEDAQIMWFCKIPNGYQVGENLPWFRSREKLDPAPRQEERYRPYVINRPEQLDNLPPVNLTLKLSPEANLIRDETFLDKVVKVAKQRGLPVQLEGSILGHTYYKLSQEHIPVILSNAPKYYRTRGKQVFGKIVRDNIPSKIVASGESVREAKLSKEDLSLGLVGKLIEETEELLRAKEKDDISAELADMLEVLMGIASSFDINWNKVLKKAKDKKQKLGGFSDGRVLIETSLPKRDNPLEGEGFIALANLGVVECTELQIEVPASTLMATVSGPGVIFTFEGDIIRYRLSIRNGKLYITKVDQKVSADDQSQSNMFDLFEN